MKRRRVWIEFVWQDMWFGVYWATEKERVYIVLLPCFPIIIDYKR
jgi:hypothetical protein